MSTILPLNQINILSPMFEEKGGITKKTKPDKCKKKISCYKQISLVYKKIKRVTDEDLSPSFCASYHYQHLINLLQKWFGGFYADILVVDQLIKEQFWLG